MIWTAMVILALLHQDFWFWDNRSLLFGFLPCGLAYHMGFSLLVSALWVFALRHAWPSDWEAWAEEPTPSRDDAPKA